MLKPSLGRAAVAACALVLFASTALGQSGPATSSADEAIARMETLLQAQQEQIESLKQQVVLASQQDMDAARIEEMRRQIREVLSEQEFRESLIPTTLQAGYDSGFFIRSTDEKFKIVFNGLLQFRWTHYGTRSENRYLSPGDSRHDRTGFDINRARLTLSGHAYDPSLTYLISFQSDAANAYDTVLSEGWVNYRMCDEFQMKFGYFRPATTRAQFRDNGQQQFVDRPLSDVVFGAGYGLGVRFWGVLLDKRLEYYFDVLNGIADGERAALGRVITTDETRELDNNPALLFRTVWHVFGPDPVSDFRSEADLPRHLEPALDFGFHYMFNQDEGDNNTRIPFPRVTFFQPGGFGLTTSSDLQFNQFGFDTQFKYYGFSATGEYYVRVLDVRDSEFAPLYRLTGDGSTNAQHGGYVQGGYMLPIPGFEDKIELVARFGGISTLSGGSEGTWEYAAGMNYYIQGNNVKLQTDVTKITEIPITNSYLSLANVNDDALIWRVQLQVAF